MGYHRSSVFLPSTKHENLTRKKSYDPVTSIQKIFDDRNSTSVPLLLCPSKLPRYVQGINQRWFSSQYHFFHLDSYQRNTSITHHKSFSNGGS